MKGIGDIKTGVSTVGRNNHRALRRMKLVGPISMA